MNARVRLPNRRPSQTFEFDHDGIRYTASVAHFVDGATAEVFLRGGKTGSAVEIMAHDAAVVLSIALQFGSPIDAIRRALLKLPDGEAAGPLGHALDLMGAALDAS